ncbi:MAG: class I SAM-dependent methyltransferase [Chloroflexales bacterium]
MSNNYSNESADRATTFPLAHTNTIAQAFDLLAEAHDAFVFQAQDLYTVRLRELLTAHLVTVPCGAYILDMGGGSGQWALDFAHAGYKVVLSDISPRMLWYACTHLTSADQIQLVCADALKPPFQPGVFQVVMLVGDVLSYLDQPAEALRALAKTGGADTLFIGTVISRIGLVIKLLRIGDSAGAWQLLRSGYAIERTKADLAFLAAKQEQAEPVAHLAFRGYTAHELRTIFAASGLQLNIVAGLNVFKSLGIMRTSTISSRVVLDCERWISTCGLWPDLSTNLFFAARA